MLTCGQQLLPEKKMFAKSESENISKCADHIVDEEPYADGEVSGGASESVPLHNYDF